MVLFIELVQPLAGACGECGTSKRCSNKVDGLEIRKRHERSGRMNQI